MINQIGKNLKRIRLLKNISLKEAGQLLNMSAPAVSKYEKGEIIPNSQKLIEFANAYSVKVVELLKSYTPPKMEFSAFRKKQKLQGKNLELLKEIIENKIAAYLEVIELNNIKTNNKKFKKYICNYMNDAEVAAFEFRKDYKLSINQPLSDLTNILENLGILIIQIKDSHHKFSGFDGMSGYVNNIPIIVLLEDSDGARQRFTIAHELGHLILDVRDAHLDIEKLCNKFAGALLMPKVAMTAEFGESRDNISYYELITFKMEYKVSMAATVYRLKELNIISEYLYKKITIWFSKNGFKKAEPIPIVSEKSYQFQKIVHKLEVSGIITLNKACELLGVSRDDYNNEDYNY